MSGISRANAFILFTCDAAGSAVLAPNRLRVEEAISAPFLIEVGLVSDQTGIDPNSVLFKPALVTLQDGSGPLRYFHGLIRRFEVMEGDARSGGAYAAEIVPALWFLSQTENSRFFESKTAEDIITSLLGNAGITQYSFKLQGTPPTRLYTVQHNESDLNFITRLMEEEGWFYFFEHSASGHNLVIADSNTAFSSLPLSALGVAANAKLEAADVLVGWSAATVTAYGNVALNDYDPTATTKDIYKSEATTLTAAGAANRNVYHWPARTLDPGESDNRARRRIEAAEAFATLCQASGWNHGAVPGGKFTVATDPASGKSNVAYAIRSVVHVATDVDWIAGGGAKSYANHLTCFPNATPWRQPLVAPKPVMAGLYTALVIGPAGQEIYTDDYARVKVQFPWSHLGDTTADGTLWLRVIQPWTGNTWGVQFLPRIGTEVAVAFLNGDPDNPVVVGGIYNSANMPVFAASDKNKSGIRTRSTMNGSTSTFSEFSFDDTIGSELVYLHAEKDYTTEVEHDHKLTITNTRVVKVGSTETYEVDDKQTVTIGNGRSVTVKQADDTLTVTDGARTVTVSKGNHSITVSQGDHSMTVSEGKHGVTVSQGDRSITVSQGKITESANGDISHTSKTGNISVEASAGKVTVTAAQSIELKVGGNSIKIDSSGVTIKGTMVKVSGEAMVELKGPMAKVNADGMLTLKGGIVQIN
ncbi:MAG: type VI secretion system Vgr family protein [Acetobacteraceae bacterium]